MKKVDMMTQLINTGAKSNVSSSKTKGTSSSDSSEFEKLLGKQQDNSSVSDTSESASDSGKPSEPANPVANGKPEEPGVEEMSIAAALVTTQPVVQIEPIEQVEVSEIAPAGMETVTMNVNENANVQQVIAAPVAAGQMDDQQAVTENVPEELVTASEETVQQATETVTMETRTDAGQEVEIGSRQRDDAPVETVKDKSDEPVVEDASAAVENDTPVFDKAEVVPVKVAESGEPVAPEAEDAAAQLGRQIEQAIANGESMVEVTLTPASLGQLTVAIARSGDGDLSIILTTVTGKAAQLLDRHVGSLQNMLADSQNVHVEIETRTHETQPQQFLNPDGQNNHHHNQQQQNQQEKEEKRDDGDFLQQLRLGLVGLN